MKKYGTIIALGLAVLFGIIAVVLVNRWMTTQETVRQTVAVDTAALSKIVVAAQNLEVGTPLSRQNLTLAEWPKSSIPKGAFERIEEVEGRIAITRLVAGEPLLNPELAEPGSGAGLVALIPKGKRAMSIRVDEVIGVAGFILPNTFVDVIAVGDPTKNKGHQVNTILTKVKVLAIAQETTTEEGKAKLVSTVTMELSPDEAEQLALQTHMASIHLILRNPLDEEEVVEKSEPKPVVKRAPVRVYRPKVTAPAPSGPAPYSIEVIKGSKEPEKIKFKSESSDERL